MTSLDGAFWGIAGENVAVALLLAGAFWFLRSALPREPWRTAWRQLRGRPAAMASLGILAVYAAVALLDSVSWRDPLCDERGQARRDAGNRPVLEARALTLLDRSSAALRRRKEKTYSAPLASEQFSREMVQDAEGRSAWIRPRLRHPGGHLLGTDKVGNDVFFRALKGVRTGMVIGGMTVLIAIPFALLFGVLAGYFGGWVDDVIQYLYTTLASIPGILLIVAFLMIFKQRSLWQICLVLGITSWTGLCRLVRAETLKLRELEYVQAAVALGISRAKILLRHVVPNLLHLVTISAVLQFSGLVLAEAVLAYVGVGVGTDTGSWGNMINTARLELSRDPLVWWNILAAFVLMMGLVLPANLFGDALRDALDPRLRTR